MSAVNTAASADPFAHLPGEVDELLKSLGSQAIAGKSGHASINFYDLVFTSYTLYFLLGVALVLLLIFVFLKKQKSGGLAPKGRFVNAMEWLVDFIRTNIVEGVIEHNPMKYFPFVATIFVFVLVCNYVGLIPGAKAGTGVMSATISLSLIVFVYFNYLGIKKKGFFGYFGGLVPKGLPKWIIPLVWVIEFFSLLLKPITQALRLFANMFAGHIILGIFAILTQLFLVTAIEQVKPLTALPAVIWMVLLIALYALEFLVALIQAYVFALLTAVYINAAEADH